MHVCANCKETLSVMGTDQPRQFPAFTLAAGLVGTVAGAVTGVLLLVPAGMLLGAAADVHWCGVCGAEIQEGEPSFRLMDELDNGLGQSVYRPMPDLHAAANPLQSAPTATARQMAQPRRQDLSPKPASGPADPSESGEREAQPDYTFDELQGVLVPRERPLEEAIPPQEGLLGELPPLMEPAVEVSQPPASIDCPLPDSGSLNAGVPGLPLLPPAEGTLP